MTADESPSGSASTGRAAVADVLAEAVGRLGGPPEPRTAADYLELIDVAGGVEAGSRALLRETVLAARSVGVTWPAIGDRLGVSKQAAQKRFAADPADAEAPAGPDERLLGPIGFRFDERAELELAGRYGWHLVEVGTYFHRLRHASTQYEHVRVSMLTGKAAGLGAQGWITVGSSFPYTYLVRDLAVPALTEPD